MIKKLSIIVLFFILGIGISFVVEPYLRKLIQNLFRFLTNDKIVFVGKDFHILNQYYYYLSFGILTLTFWFSIKELKVRQIIFNIFLTATIFFFTIVLICYLDSNLKIIECTMCDDGIRKIRYNEINYDLIVAISVFASLIPNIIRIIKKRRQAHNNGYSSMPA